MIQMIKMKNAPRYTKENHFQFLAMKHSQGLELEIKSTMLCLLVLGQMCKHSDYKSITEHLFGDIYFNSTQLKKNCHFTYLANV